MNFLSRFAVSVLVLVLAGCGRYEVEEYETGYKGAARINPWLAAERFVERGGHPVESLKSWREPGYDDTVWFAPASVLGNASYVNKAGDWIRQGGHLVLLVENAGAEMNDWGRFGGEVEVADALKELLEEAGIKMEDSVGGGGGLIRNEHTVEFGGDKFRIEAGARTKVSASGDPAGMLASGDLGDGRVTVVADARVFRNRWIDEHDHAALLLALIESTEYEGTVWFSRGASLSFLQMVKAHLGPVLFGLAALLVIWLWKNMPRFGPLESPEAPSTARGYGQQLAAVGNYHWRTDRAAVLLAPLRERVVERGLRAGHRATRGSEEFHAWLAERAGLSVERVAAALSPVTVKDRASLTRVTADLQILLRSIH